MSFNYLESFPIPVHVLPSRLRELLEPVSLSPNQRVEVACKFEFDQHGTQSEHLHLQMAVVPGADEGPIKFLDESNLGVVEFSVPFGDKYGCSTNFSPSISGYDYIIAAWGNGSFYTFNLAEKVWMLLGLSPRSVGNNQQRLIYDDLRLPEFGVAEGEVSSKYHWNLKRNVCWRMSNEYLRRYLWIRGARGVRVFYYKAQLDDIPEIRSLMDGDSHLVRKPTGEVPWYNLDICEHNDGLQIEVWASVEALMPELCTEQSADGIIWPGDVEPMTRERANSYIFTHPVYLDDRFLIKYEQSKFYDSTPYRKNGNWYSSPSYNGQWSFTDCRRVGRNLIKVPIRELYKPKPDREILHAKLFAVDLADLSHLDLSEEHIVSKVHRLLNAFLNLGDCLSELGSNFEFQKLAYDLTGFNRNELLANGWLTYHKLSRLAQVAPLDMTQQEFLARCKSLHEVLERLPNGYLKKLLTEAGIPKSAVGDLGSLKLLQAILNIVENLNANEETVDAFKSNREPHAWSERNEVMTPLFLNYDLRIADAHEAMEDCLATLQKLGFDIANVNAGYGKALDFVIDSVINSLNNLSKAIEKLINNK